MALQGTTIAKANTLPALSQSSSFHSDCCLSLSHEIIAQIAAHLPQDGTLALSIGSGSGLLEALVMKEFPQIQLEGVEVGYTINTYLSEQSINVVHRSEELCSRARDASCLLFVYPRTTKLVSRYVEELRQSSVLCSMVWLGPSRDWEDFEQCFEPLRCVFDQTSPRSISTSEVMVCLHRSESGPVT